MTTYNTKYGPIFYDNTGNDNRSNMVDSKPKFQKFHEPVKMQRAAVRAFRAAEVKYGRFVAKRAGWKFTHARAILVTGSWRSFDAQAAYYNSDPNRYASPYTSGHVQGIAFDLNTTNPDFDKQRSIFLSLGWKQARSDEPWHFTLGPSV